MSDDEQIFTEEEREELCLDDSCEEHGDGDVACGIPRTKEKARIQLNTESETSAGASLQNVSPTTATGKVVRSDE